MFKVGDRVIHKYGILRGAVGIVLSKLDNHTYEVKFDRQPKVIFVTIGSELEHETPVLPIGDQDQLGFPEEILSNKCDCGGYKVFGVAGPEGHSPWCSSVSKSLG